MRAIKSFTDLVAWREGHQLVLLIYRVTAAFPQQEMYSLVDQLRRACVSITSNIAEGFSRSSAREKRQFYYVALGSLTEVQNQLLVSRDLHYLSPEEFATISLQTVVVSKLINGLLKSAVSHT